MLTYSIGPGEERLFYTIVLTITIIHTSYICYRTIIIFKINEHIFTFRLYI